MVQAPRLIPVGNFLFRYRDGLHPLALIALLLLTRPHVALGREGADHVVDAAGLLLIVLGQTLRAAVVGYAYIIRGGRGRKVYAEDLVTGGMFATSRNPLYLGNLLIYFGLLVIWNSPWAYLLGVPFYLFFYRSIVAAEEAYLLAHFGDAYLEYCRDVGRWIPNLGRLGDGLEGMTFNWRRVVLKEYGTVAAWVLTVLFLLLLESSRFSRVPIEPVQLAMAASVAAPLVALWAFVRWLKLSGRLQE